MSLSSNFPTSKPSLNLDFANTKRLDPRVTFTRSTTGTYYDGVTTAMAEQNLFTYSQDFSNADWTVDGATKTSTNNTDPAGGSTALLLTKTAADSYSLRQYAFAGGSPANLTATISFYLKGTAGDTVVLYLDNGVNQGFASTVTLTASWARYTLTSTFNSTTANLTGGVSFRSPSTATSVYVAFAQVEYRATATAYTATTTQAITNYIPVLLTAAANVPRFDHNPTTDESLGLLIEAERTNLMLQSEAVGTSPWSGLAAAVEANTIVSPDGTVDGDKVYEGTGNNYQNRFQSVAQTATTYAFSVYAKKGQTDRFVMFAGSPQALLWIDMTTWTVFASTNVVASSITAVGNGWYRCTLIYTNTSASSFQTGINLVQVGTTNTVLYAGNGFNGMYLWGAQLEEASFPTSYIATTSLAVTRTVDAVTMTGAAFAGFNNNQQFTVICKASRWTTAFVGSQESVWSVAQSSPAGVVSGLMLSGLSYRAYYESAADLYVYSAWTANTSSTFAQAYQIDNYAACANGGSVATDSSGDFGLSVGFDTLYIGRFTSPANQFNGWVQKFAYYPQRVTNAQLQALSS